MSRDVAFDVIHALQEKGVSEKNIRYLEVKNGRHEPNTWGKAMPDFWGWAFG
ncbi:MAG: hypothetical protein ACKVT2_12565 [Saprospiraceae bacterium]